MREYILILLSAEAITKSYREGNLLDGVSLYLEEGDKAGIIGINGTGKSTLLKIIAGVEQPDSGSVVTASGVRIGYLQRGQLCSPRCFPALLPRRGKRRNTRQSLF